MNTFFNLTTEKWISAIPTSGANGQKTTLSLCEVFEQATQLQELHDDIPIVLPPMLRLLLAILHRAWQGQTRSERYEEWWQWWNQAQFPARVYEYLDEQKEKFYLFHPTQPFYQTAGLEVGKEDKLPKSILCLLLNQDNNPTLFDHNMESRPPAFSCAEAARALLVGQSYMAGGTGGQDVKINGVAYKKPSNFFQGPLFSSAVVWLNGRTLFETLMLNLSPERAGLDGTPVWEKPIEQQIEESNDAQPSVTSGVTDRFTFQNRLLRLLPERDEKSGEIVVRHVLVAQGRKPSAIGDEMMAYYENKTKGRTSLRLDRQKSVWRDSQIIFSSEQAKLGPSSFAHAARVAKEQSTSSAGLRIGSRFKVSVVGISIGDNAAKVMLWRHERMPVPIELLDDPNTSGRISVALDYANKVARRLLNVNRVKIQKRDKVKGGSGRMWRVAGIYCYPNFDHPNLELRSKEKDLDHERIAQIAESFDPLLIFWSRLETPFHAFLLQLPIDATTALQTWMNMAEDQAQIAFQTARDALGTSPRALATAAVSSDFRREERRSADKAKRLENDEQAGDKTEDEENIQGGEE